MKKTLIFLLLSFNLYAADFDRAFEITMYNEGGETFTSFHYDNDGGGTKYGVSLNQYRAIAAKNLKEYDNDLDGSITKNDLRLLTMGGAKNIYKKYYLDKVGGDKIKSQLAAEVMYDYLVNGGFSLKKVQRLVGVQQKGKIDLATIKAINQQPCEVSRVVLQDRGRWLFSVMKRTRPATYANCKNGWKNRVNRFVKQYKTKCKDEKFSYFTV